MDDARGLEADDGKEHDAVLRLLSSDEWQRRLEQARLARESVLAKRPERKPALADLGQSETVHLRLVPETGLREAFFDEEEGEPDAEPADAPAVMPAFRRDPTRSVPVAPSIRLNQRLASSSAQPRPPISVNAPPVGVSLPRPNQRAADSLPPLAAPAPDPARGFAPERSPKLGSRIVAGFALGLVAGVGASVLVWMAGPATMPADPPIPAPTAETAGSTVVPGVGLASGDSPELTVAPGIESVNLAIPAPNQLTPVSAAPAPLAAAPGPEIATAFSDAYSPPGVWMLGDQLANALLDAPHPPIEPAGMSKVVIRDILVPPQLTETSHDIAPEDVVTLAALRPFVTDVVTAEEANNTAIAMSALPAVLPRVVPSLTRAVSPGLGVPPVAGVPPSTVEPPPPAAALIASVASTPSGTDDGPTAIVRLLVPVEQDASAADGLAEATRAAGFTIENTDPVSVTIKATHVRFYHSEDGAAAMRLASSIGGEARDFTSSSVRVPEGTIELWMKGGAPGPTAKPKVVKTKSAKAAKPAGKPAKAAAPREDPQVRALRDKVLNKLKTVNKS
jgi:hypothetical protein